MSSQNGEESADCGVAGGETMLGPPQLYTSPHVVDRSIKEMVSRVATRGCAPTR